MTNGLTSPRATDRPPGPTPQAARGAPPPSDAFAGMLDAQQARTATAEGHDENADKGAANVSAAPDAQKPAQDQDGQKQDGTGSDAPTASAAAAALAALPVPVTATPGAAPAATAGAAPATQMVVAGGQPTPVVQVVVPGDAAPAQPVAQANVASIVPVAQAPVVVPGAVQAATTAATPATAATGKAPTAATSVPVPQPAAPQSQTTAAVASQAAPVQTAAKPQPDTTQPAQVAPNAGPVTGLAGAVRQQPGQPQTGQQPQQQPQLQQPVVQNAPQVAAVTSPAPATPATPLPAATPVSLAQTAETVEHVLSLASARGITHARIALHPAELGSIDVHIRSTADGLVARVVAHSAEAVQTLQHSAGDLRRSLEEQGINVLNLDVSQSGESGTGRAGSESNGRSTYEGPSAGTDGDETTTTETRTLRLPSGVLVDVLA